MDDPALTSSFSISSITALVAALMSATSRAPLPATNSRFPYETAPENIGVLAGFLPSR